MRAGEIARLLARDAEGICWMLLPEGKRQGNEWCVGSVRGEPGESCRVHLGGDKAGVWKDFSSHERGGDLLDLWAAVKGIPLPDAIAEAKSHLGVADPTFHSHRLPSKRPEKPKCSKVSGEVLQWLKGRKLSESAIEAYKIAANGKEAVFPYLHGSELMFCKMRNIDDKSRMRVVKDSVPCLFGWQAIPDDAREVVICEGELDAPAWWMMGYPALSVPNGAAGFSWIENEFDRLERFDRIYIAFDSTDVGPKCAVELAERLGIERCRIVDTSPWKDANDVIQAGQHIAGQQMIEKAKTISPKELKEAREYMDRVLREFDPDAGIESGFAAPWNKTEGKVFFRRGEITIVNGVNGHGKSQFVGQLALSAMEQGERVCIFSGEMKPERLLYRLVRQAAALENGLPTKDYIHAIMEWFGEKCWLFDLTGSAKVNRLMEIFRYARARFGVTVFVIDSMLTCDIDQEDNEAQRRFVEAVRDFKNETDAHVFLVTHSRKLHDEMRPSGKMDVRGAGAVTDLVDNVTIVWRNKKKESDIANANMTYEEVPPDVEARPDALWIWEKQRNGDWEGKLSFWWHANSFSYVAKKGYRPRPVIEHKGQESADGKVVPFNHNGSGDRVSH